MQRVRLGLLALILLTLAPGGEAVTGDTSTFTKLADGVYAYVGKRNDANAMVVVTAQGVVVVDTGNNQPETRQLLQQIQAVTSQPIRYVVVTQNHGDHVGGIPLFAPPATVIVHERVAQDWARLAPHVIRAWRRRFPERQDALKHAHPLDTVVSFSEHLTLHLGGTIIELIYVDAPYNPGDLAVWLPQSGVLHGGFAAYKDRHPDLRPDYSHGTTAGMLKQLEVLIALKPRVVVPSHGPLGDERDLRVMVDYLRLARGRVRALMDQGLTPDGVRAAFHLHEYPDWDRTAHLPLTAATIYRELSGQGPEPAPAATQKQLRGTIARIAEEGRFLTVVADGGQEIALRISSGTDFEGVPDRSHLKVGMKVTALYEEQRERNEVLEIRAEP